MPAKLQCLGFPSKICKWIYLAANISSISCAQRQKTTLEFNVFPASAFESLRYSFFPKNLLKILYSQNGLGYVVRTFNWASLKHSQTAEVYCSIITKLGLNLYICDAKCKDSDIDDVLVCLVHSFFTLHKVNVSMLVIEAMIFGHCKPALDICNLVMDAVLLSKEFECVFFIYKEMVKAGIAPNVHTLNYLIEALFKMGQVHYAMKQFKTINRKGCYPNSKTFRIIIGYLLERNLVDEAAETLHEMLVAKCEPDTSFYESIVPLFCQFNKLEEIMKLFATFGVSNVSCSFSVYDCVIRCLLHNSRLDDSVALVQGMTRQGLGVSVDLLVEVVKSFCVIEKPDKAKAFLDHMNTDESLPYNILLNEYRYFGDNAMAECLFIEMMERRVADTESFNIIMTLYFESGVFEKAYQVLARMIAALLVPNSGTYSALVIGKCMLNDWEGSVDLIRFVVSRNWVLESTSYAELVKCLCYAGKIEQAVNIFCYMNRRGCSLQSLQFNMLVKGVCMNGKLNKAIGLLRLINHSCMSSTTYDIIMHHLSMEGRERDILVLLSRMLVGGYAMGLETYWILIMNMSKQQRNNCALLFNMMIDRCSQPDSRRILHMFRCLSRHHQLHTVFPAVEKLVLIEGALDSSAYNLLINGLWKEGYETEAHGLLNLMLEKGWVPDSSTHQLLMGSDVKEGQYEIIEDKVSDILADGLGSM